MKSFQVGNSPRRQWRRRMWEKMTGNGCWEAFFSKHSPEGSPEQARARARLCAYLSRDTLLLKLSLKSPKPMSGSEVGGSLPWTLLPFLAPPLWLKPFWKLPSHLLPYSFDMSVLCVPHAPWVLCYPQGTSDSIETWPWPHQPYNTFKFHIKNRFHTSC